MGKLHAFLKLKDILTPLFISLCVREILLYATCLQNVVSDNVGFSFCLGKGKYHKAATLNFLVPHSQSIFPSPLIIVLEIVFIWCLSSH